VPRYRFPPGLAADISPRTGVPTRVSRVLTRDALPPPDYPFAWERPPLSGNVVNGLHETEPRRAVPVFHTNDYSDPWGGLELYFHLTDSAAVQRSVLAAQWDNRRRVGPVAPDRRVVDPAGAAAEVRDVARRAGAAVVGTTRLRDHHLYAGERCELPHAISVAVVMDREAMRTVPSEEATRAVLDAYRRVGRVAIAVAEHIRAAGWSARAATNLEKGSSEVLHVPVAIDAGLGQLGKHGSLITAEHGSNVRLATVLTDLPLVPDEPADLGVDDFCATCRLCTTHCPPHAILDAKQTVRGVEKWYVDFDACVPYFSDNGGCGICIEVCPWSEPGRGPLLSARVLQRRRREPGRA
jgi:epoxyqueuosine reductase